MVNWWGLPEEWHAEPEGGDRAPRPFHRNVAVVWRAIVALWRARR